MTDTAAAADLVLPCTAFLEEEDLYYNSMSHCYLSATGPKLSAHPGNAATNTRLCGPGPGTGSGRLPAASGGRALAKLIMPLARSKGITLQQLKAGPLLPGAKSLLAPRPLCHGRREI